MHVDVEETREVWPPDPADVAQTRGEGLRRLGVGREGGARHAHPAEGLVFVVTALVERREGILIELPNDLEALTDDHPRPEGRVGLRGRFLRAAAVQMRGPGEGNGRRGVRVSASVLGTKEELRKQIQLL